MLKKIRNKRKSENIDGSDNWRKCNYEYVENISKFLDIVDNVEDEKLKNRIIYQHFTCEKIIEKFFKKNK